jgi:hypothetical protein
MNELLQSLQEKVGLTSEQAKAAVDHITEYFKSKIPASLHEHLDAASIGNTIKTKGAELFAQAQSGGSELLKSMEEKLSGFMHSSKEA